MIIDIRKKATPVETAAVESKEVQKQFLKLKKIMSRLVHKYHAKVPHARNLKE